MHDKGQRVDTVTEPIESGGMPSSVADMLARWAAATPDATALRFDGKAMSFKELRDQARRVANGFVEFGAEPRDRIAVLGRNSVEIMEVVFAAAELNAVSVSVNWRLTEREIAAILEDAGVRILVISGEFDSLARLRRERGMHVIVYGAPRTVPDGALAYEEWKARQSAESLGREVGP